MKHLLWIFVFFGLLCCMSTPAKAQNPNPCSQVTNTATAGQVLSAVNGGSTPPCKWVAGGGGGSGTVTSVGFSTNLGTVTGSPVTTSGTLTNTVSAAQVVSLFSTCSGVQYLGADGACHNSGGIPGSPANSVQFNNAGSFGGITGSTWDGTTLDFAGNGTPGNVITHFGPGSPNGNTFEFYAVNDFLANGAGMFVYSSSNNAAAGGFQSLNVLAENVNPSGAMGNAVGALITTTHTTAGTLGSAIAETLGVTIGGGAGAVTNAIGLQVNNIVNATNNWAIKTGTGEVQWGDVELSTGVAFASLPTPTNGMEIYCTNCTVTSSVDNTCVGAGTGAWAYRINGVWKCAF